MFGLNLKATRTHVHGGLQADVLTVFDCHRSPVYARVYARVGKAIVVQVYREGSRRRHATLVHKGAPQNFKVPPHSQGALGRVKPIYTLGIGGL